MNMDLITIFQRDSGLASDRKKVKQTANGETIDTSNRNSFEFDISTVQIKLKLFQGQSMETKGRNSTYLRPLFVNEYLPDQ